MSRFDNFTLSSARDLMYRVYGWMGAGLALSGAVAWGVATSPTAIKFLFSNPLIILGLFIAQIALIFVLQSAVKKLNTGAAAASFIAYSALNGLTLSSIFLVYTLTSIATTFAIAAGMFLAMAIYGYATQRDLTSMGSYLTMGIVGLIIAMLVNMFVKSGEFGFLISIAGVIIFTLLTAYDAQKIKELAKEIAGTGVPLDAVAISGALTLYLDFINLFLYLLRMFGKRKD